MQVLALVTDAFGGHGGIARYNRDLLTALSTLPEIGQITVLPRIAADLQEALPQRVHQLTPVGGRAAYSLAALQLARRLKKGSLIFCGHVYMAPAGAAAAAISGAPMWLQAHGTDIWNPLSRCARWSAPRARLVTAVSHYTRQRMLEWWSGDPSRIEVLHNTVDASFTPGPKSEALAEKYGLAGRRVMLTVARLSKAERYKGHDRVIMAMPAILARYPQALYLIVGDGDDEPRLRSMVIDMGLGEHVRFTGRAPVAQLADHYRLGEVFVMPSTQEGFGIVFLEAAACGLHVIGGNADGSVDALGHGAVGEAIDPLSIDAIAGAVCRALERQDRPDPHRVDAFSFENFRGRVGELVASLGGGG